MSKFRGPFANIIKTTDQDIPISEDKIEKLFAEASSGNYMRLKSHLLENHMLAHVENSKHDSILHIIINNSNITQNEKLELLKIAVDHGAPINIPGENKITPLHLACKNQELDLVKFLMAHGANVSIKDNQKKTPLHYAVVGHNTKCMSSNDLKIKPLVPKKVEKQNTGEGFDSAVEKLKNAILSKITNDAEIIKYTTHIKHTFDIIEQMYPSEFERIKQNIQDDIQKIS